MNRLLLLISLLFILLLSTSNAASVTISLENTLNEERFEVPVFISIKQIFGDDYDYASIELNNFSIHDSKYQEVAYSYISQPPYLKKGKDEIFFIISSIEAQEIIKYTINYGGEGALYDKRLQYHKVSSNFFRNPGFEGSITDSYDLHGSVIRDDKEKVSGQSSLLLKADHNKTVWAQQKKGFLTRKGETYELRFWAKSSNLPVADSGGWEATHLGGNIVDSTSLYGSKNFESSWWRRWINPISGNREWRMYTRQFKAKESVKSKPLWKVFYYKMKWLRDEPGKMWVDNALFYIPLKISIEKEPLRRKGAQKVLFFTKPIQKAIFNDVIPNPQDIVDKYKGIDLWMAKGDFETIQLGVYAEEDLSSVTISISEPTSLNSSIPVENIELFYLDSNEFLRDLYPMNIRAKESQGFALRIHTKGVDAGEYYGTITIASDKKKLGTLPVGIKVLPYNLPRIEDRYLGHIFPFNSIKKFGDAGFRNAAKHSYNFIMFFDYTGICDDKNGWAFDQFLERINNTGLDLVAVGLYSDIVRTTKYRKGPCASSNDISRLNQLAIEKGWPNLLFMMDDELFSNYQHLSDVNSIRRALEKKKKSYSSWANENQTARITTDTNFVSLSFFHEPYTWIGFDNPYGGMNQDILDWLDSIGKPYGYAGPGGKGAELQRFTNGFNILKVDAKHVYGWMYNKLVEVSGTQIIDSLSHEAMREGFDDIGWYYLLQKSIERGKEYGNATQQEKALEAEVVMDEYFNLFSADSVVGTYEPLEGLPGKSWGEYAFSDNWRRVMISFIVEIDGLDGY